MVDEVDEPDEAAHIVVGGADGHEREKKWFPQAR